MDTCVTEKTRQELCTVNYHTAVFCVVFGLGVRSLLLHSVCSPQGVCFAWLVGESVLTVSLVFQMYGNIVQTDVREDVPCATLTFEDRRQAEVVSSPVSCCGVGLVS